MTESDVKHHNPHLTFVIYISEIRRSWTCWCSKINRTGNRLFSLVDNFLKKCNFIWNIEGKLVVCKYFRNIMR
jgi:hypothetical protein